MLKCYSEPATYIGISGLEIDVLSGVLRIGKNLYVSIYQLRLPPNRADRQGYKARLVAVALLVLPEECLSFLVPAQSDEDAAKAKRCAPDPRPAIEQLPERLLGRLESSHLVLAIPQL